MFFWHLTLAESGDGGEGGRRQSRSVKCLFPPCKHEDLSFQRWRDGGRQVPATHRPTKPKWDTVSVPVGLLCWVPLRLSSRLCTHIHMCMYTRIHSGTCTHRIHMHRGLGVSSQSLPGPWSLRVLFEQGWTWWTSERLTPGRCWGNTREKYWQSGWL